ncbi:MAG TPA: DUF3667 domain-containing protein [Chthoniobacterales bacterium]|nr:DUF3667 domain-containing protein [Chthoniobacterales bacterium]
MPRFRKLQNEMSDDPAKIILAETAVSAMEESPRRRLLRRRKAGESRQINNCENCGAPLHGHFCAKCGQAAVEYRRSFRHVIVDVLDSFLNWDSKFFATLAWLIARPWHLTNEFVQGRRVRYLHPVRLYLLASILFFFVVNWWARAIHMDPSGMAEAEKAEVVDAMKDVDLPTGVRQRVEAALEGASPIPGLPVEPEGTPSAKPRGGRTLIQFDDHDNASPFGKWLEGRAKEKMGEHGTKMELFVKTLVSNLPYMVLCCIPFFALVLKLLYIRRRIFYIDHLVYALHIHSFAYVALILIGLITMLANRFMPGWLAGCIIALLWFAFAVQIFLSIRRVYRQGWVKSFVKFWLGGAVYLVILLLGLAATFFATLIVP